MKNTDWDFWFIAGILIGGIIAGLLILFLS